MHWLLCLCCLCVVFSLIVPIHFYEHTNRQYPSFSFTLNSLYLFFFFLFFNFSLCFSSYVHAKCLQFRNMLFYFEHIFWYFSHLCFFFFSFFFCSAFFAVVLIKSECYENVWKCQTNAGSSSVRIISNTYGDPETVYKHLIDSISNIFRFRICIHKLCDVFVVAVLPLCQYSFSFKFI